ncbi:MAG: ATP-dependent DNA ligase [Candidatus Woesearchaeota archaeon]|nr:ATP-dependent DNA ligase [Candidatus Woesearchaeota archaeon]
MDYSHYASLYDQLEKTSKRLEKTHILSEFLKKVPSDEMETSVFLLQGRIFPEWEDKKIGISSRLIIKAIKKATGLSEKIIEESWKKEGDLGNVVEQLISQKKQFTLVNRTLSAKEVIEKIRHLEAQGGKGSVEQKLSIISDLLVNSEPREAKYIIRLVADNMRVGVGSGSLRDAIIWAFVYDVTYDSEKNDISLTDEKRQEYNILVEKVQSAYDILNDFSRLAVILKSEGMAGLEKIRIRLGSPINPMLFVKAKDIEDAFSIVGRPAVFEIKYDGFRIQAHVSKEIRLFTRRLEEVTEQFPDVVQSIKDNVKTECILDCEAIGFEELSGKYLPFQKISQRIKRKYGIAEMAKQFPVELNVFDIIYHDGKSLINEPYKKRRELLEKIIPQKEKKIVLAKQMMTSDNDEAQKFYDYALNIGEEGCMAKNLEGIYKPGARVGYGVKIKSILEPLDLVIVGAEYGEGKRSGMLSSFYLACAAEGEFLEIGKVSTGLKENEGEGVTFEELTKLLVPLITKVEGKLVTLRPEIVIEVGYEEIQASSSYSSGFALRFPRFLRLRSEEKTAEDINTLEDVQRLYAEGSGRG